MKMKAAIHAGFVLLAALALLGVMSGVVAVFDSTHTVSGLQGWFIALLGGGAGHAAFKWWENSEMHDG